MTNNEATGTEDQVRAFFLAFYRAEGRMDLPQFTAQDNETRDIMAECATRVWTERAAALAALMHGSVEPIRQIFGGEDELEESEIVSKLNASLRGAR